MAKGDNSRTVKVYAWALVLLIGVGSVTSKRSEDESYVESAFDWATNNPGKAVIGAAAGAGAAVLGAPYAVGYLGFTATGIAAKSTAAWAMSWFAGATPAAGVVATLQSIGATGTLMGSGAATTLATGTVGAVTGAAVVKAVSESDDKGRD